MRCDGNGGDARGLILSRTTRAVFQFDGIIDLFHIQIGFALPIHSRAYSLTRFIHSKNTKWIETFSR